MQTKCSSDNQTFRLRIIVSKRHPELDQLQNAMGLSIAHDTDVVKCLCCFCWFKFFSVLVKDQEHDCKCLSVFYWLYCAFGHESVMWTDARELLLKFNTFYLCPQNIQYTYTQYTKLLLGLFTVRQDKTTEKIIFSDMIFMYGLKELTMDGDYALYSLKDPNTTVDCTFLSSSQELFN